VSTGSVENSQQFAGYRTAEASELGGEGLGDGTVVAGIHLDQPTDGGGVHGRHQPGVVVGRQQGASDLPDQVGLQAGPSQTTIKLLLVLVFMLFTAPTATHALAKAAIHGRVRPRLEHSEDPRFPT